MASTESSRERDLNKYFQPWQVSSSKAIPTDEEEQAHRSICASHDTTLTALAQLGALRLRAKRCLISLIDSSTQIILAEATQTLSLVNNNRHAPGDHLWLGSVSVPRRDCMDEHVFGSNWIGYDSDGSKHILPALVVNDTTQDDRFRLRPYVTSSPAQRFYAGVPIVTKQGHAIGVYAVSDVAPRPEGLTLEEIHFMHDVSHVVTEHLERVKVSIDRTRGDRFVRSLTSFVEGLSPLKHKLEDVNDLQQTGGSKQSPAPQAVDAQASSPKLNSNYATFTSPNHTESTIVEDPNPQSVGNTWPKHVRQKSSTSSAHKKDDVDESTTNLRQIFHRAARLLQKGLGAEGCVFYDATAESSSLVSALHRGRSYSDELPDNSSSETIPGTSENCDHNTDKNLAQHASSKRNQRPHERRCQILGLSFALPDNQLSKSFPLPKRKLNRCLRKFPYGKVFYLHRGGAVASNENDLDNFVSGGGGDDDLHSRHASAISDLAMNNAEGLPQDLLDQIPNAKWLIFLPLFNYAQDQWCAGGFIWFDNNGPSDPQDEMPYLKAFGSCIMSEVASMEAVNTNIAKTRFIASMSHDLRSPLHGMLGSLEFLEDTMTSAYQLSLLSSVETCGKTLLDTIDHLLDFAKINNLSRKVPKNNSTLSLDTTKDNQGANGKGLIQLRMSSFDVSVLMEEVLEAVFAGQTFRKRRIRGHDSVDDAVEHIAAMNVDDSTSTDEQIHAGSAKFSGKVFVIFDMQKAKCWKVRSQPGALRRVIMNLFGNAIKYCSDGAIEVSLNMQQQTSSEAEVVIVVKDTGIGMSQKFLEHHLFRAFSQEDSFTPGAGLGLSIVHQIVQSLNGSIRVESEKDVGTNVTVTLPMQLDAGAPNEEEDILVAATRVTKGKKLALLVPEEKSNDSGKEDVFDSHFSKLTASIAKMCKEWFGMDFFETTSLEVETDFLMYREPPPIEVLTAYHSRKQAAGKDSKEIALLIVCTNAFEAAALRAAGVQHLVLLGSIIEVISQPLGVRKMAKVLLQSCQRIQQNQRTSEQLLSSSATSQQVGASEAKDRASQIEWNTSSLVYDNFAKKHRPSIDAFRWKSEQPHSDRASTQSNIEFGQVKSGVLPEVTPFELQSNQEDASEPDRVPSVLLVDDNAINLKLLVTFVKKIQLPYAQAENGLEALEKFKEAEQPFDFVLMDLQMPVMDGLESTRKIRVYEKEKQFKTAATIIAITGIGDANVKTQCMETGFNEFLTKPVKFKVLQQMLERQKIK